MTGPAGTCTPRRYPRAPAASSACRESDEKLIDLHSYLLVHEQRHGHHQTYAGRPIHRLARVGGGWKIRYRVLLRIDRDVPQGNITFVL
jgi:3-phenylpropionate/cinnamic acid dioxygenase small subunit